MRCSKVDVLWDGTRWSFGAWDVPTETTACLDRVVRTEIVPEEPTRVHLTLEGGEAQ